MKWYSKYIGTPWKALGRDKNGADCYGLVRLILKEQYGIMIPSLINDYSDVENKEEIENLINAQKPLLTGALLETPEEGAIILFESRGFTAHIGIVVSNKYLIHTTSSQGAVLMPLKSQYIQNRIKGYYRVNKDYSTT